jgi:hypothetical protein
MNLGDFFGRRPKRGGYGADDPFAGMDQDNSQRQVFGQPRLNESPAVPATGGGLPPMSTQTNSPIMPPVMPPVSDFGRDGGFAPATGGGLPPVRGGFPPGEPPPPSMRDPGGWGYDFITGTLKKKPAY